MQQKVQVFVLLCIHLIFFLQNMQCGESVTIEGQIYMVYSVTHRYQLRKGKYEPSEKRLDVLSSGRYIVNLYLQNLLEQSWFIHSWSSKLLNLPTSLSIISISHVRNQIIIQKPFCFMGSSCVYEGNSLSRQIA